MKRARQRGPGLAGQMDAQRQSKAHLDTESVAEAARLEGQGMGVEQPPVTGCGR